MCFSERDNQPNARPVKSEDINPPAEPNAINADTGSAERQQDSKAKRRLRQYARNAVLPVRASVPATQGGGGTVGGAMM